MPLLKPAANEQVQSNQPISTIPPASTDLQPPTVTSALAPSPSSPVKPVWKSSAQKPSQASPAPQPSTSLISQQISVQPSSQQQSTPQSPAQKPSPQQLSPSPQPAKHRPQIVPSTRPSVPVSPVSAAPATPPPAPVSADGSSLSSFSLADYLPASMRKPAVAPQPAAQAAPVWNGTGKKASLADIQREQLQQQQSSRLPTRAGSAWVKPLAEVTASAMRSSQQLVESIWDLPKESSPAPAQVPSEIAEPPRASRRERKPRQPQESKTTDVKSEDAKSDDSAPRRKAPKVKEVDVDKQHAQKSRPMESRKAKRQIQQPVESKTDSPISSKTKRKLPDPSGPKLNAAAAEFTPFE